jgi:S-adenosylmethionine decarboxylase
MADRCNIFAAETGSIKSTRKTIATQTSGKHFGEHVMIDGYKCSEDRLNDRNVVLACLTELPPQLLMKPLSWPEIYFAEGSTVKDSGGWTGFIVIQESHISVHTFPALRFVSIDVYTCKNGLNVAAIEDYFREKLSIEVFETQVVKRGRQFFDLALCHAAKRMTNHGASSGGN